MNKKKFLTRNGISCTNYIKINRNSSTGNTRGNTNMGSKYLNKEIYAKNLSNISNKDYSENNSKRIEELKKVNNNLNKKCTKSFNNEPIKTGLTFESLLFSKENKNNEIKQNIYKQNSEREKMIDNMIYPKKHKNKSLDNIENLKRENLNINNSKMKEKMLIDKRKNYNKTINNDDNISNRKYLYQNDKFRSLYNEDIEKNKRKIHLSDKNTIEKKDFTFGNFLSFREDNFQKDKIVFENNSQRVYKMNKEEKENKYINKNLELSRLTELDYRIENLKKNLNSLNLIELMSEEYSNYKINENNNEIENIDDLLTHVKMSNDNFYKEINKKLKNIEEILTYK